VTKKHRGRGAKQENGEWRIVNGDSTSLCLKRIFDLKEREDEVPSPFGLARLWRERDRMREIISVPPSMAGRATEGFDEFSVPV